MPPRYTPGGHCYAPRARCPLHACAPYAPAGHLACPQRAYNGPPRPAHPPSSTCTPRKRGNASVPYKAPTTAVAPSHACGAPHGHPGPLCAIAALLAGCITAVTLAVHYGHPHTGPAACTGRVTGRVPLAVPVPVHYGRTASRYCPCALPATLPTRPGPARCVHCPRYCPCALRPYRYALPCPCNSRVPLAVHYRGHGPARPATAVVCNRCVALRVTARVALAVTGRVQ